MIPESIRQLKPKEYGSCKIRAVSGHYYVYEVHSRWDKERKRAVKENGRCLGKITERDGFIPNRYGRSLLSPAGVETGKRMTVLSYGAYELLTQLSPEVGDSLREFFPDIYRELRALALLRLVDGVGPRLMHPTFLDSYMSELAPDLAMSEVSVREFVRRLGRQTDRIESFMRASILPGADLVFDGTHFFAQVRDSLSQKGYNPDRKKRKQIRLLYIFDQSTYRPQFYQVLQGSAVDKTAFIDIVKASGCQKCTVIGDKGFYSKRNASALMDSGLDLSYILPLNSNTALVKEEWLENPDRSKFDGAFAYHDRPIYFHKEALGNNGNWIYTYYDPLKALEKEARQMTRQTIKTDQTIFTDLAFLSIRSGYFSFVSNLDTSSQQVYLTYKKRGSIETCFDYLKNVVHAGPAYAHTDEGIRGWAFLNHLSLLYFYGLVDALRSKKLDARYTPADVILLSKHVYAVRCGAGPYEVAHVQKKTMELLEQLGINLTAPLQIESPSSPST